MIETNQNQNQNIEINNNNNNNNNVNITTNPNNVNNDQKEQQQSNEIIADGASTTIATPTTTEKLNNSNINNNNVQQSSPQTQQPAQQQQQIQSPKPQQKQLKDIVDFSKYYREIDRSESSPVQTVQTLIQIINSNTPDKISDSDHKNSALSFVSQWLPKYITGVLSLKNLSNDIKPEIITFLKSSLEISIGYMNYDFPELWIAFYRIFNPAHSFYAGDKFGISKEDINDIYNYKIKSESQTSYFYLKNLSVLVENNFYDKLLNLITLKPSLARLSYIVKGIYLSRDYLSIQFLNGYLFRLKEVLYNYFLDLFYEDLPVQERELYKEIYQNVQHLFAIIVPQSEITKMSQEFDLNRALRCFQSANLEKKLRGLRYIKKESTKCLRKETDKLSILNFLKKQRQLNNNNSYNNNNSNNSKSNKLSVQDNNSSNSSSTPGSYSPHFPRSDNSNNSNNNENVNNCNSSETNNVINSDNSNNENNNSDDKNANNNQNQQSQQNNNQYQSNNNSNNSNNNNNYNINNPNPQILYDWILKNEIIENCCKISDQPDIIRHCIPVMIFLCQYGVFSSSHMELLWNSLVGKHESIKNIMYSAILSLVNNLLFDSIEFLYQQIYKTIVSMKSSEYDNDLLLFLYNFTVLSIQHFDNPTISKKYFGVEIFWALCTQTQLQIPSNFNINNNQNNQNSNNQNNNNNNNNNNSPTIIINDNNSLNQNNNNSIELSQNLCIKARIHFIQILKLPECSSLRTQYLEVAIENLKNNISIVESLAVIVNIIDPKKQKTFIETLEQKYKIFDLFFKEIANYKKTAQEKLKIILNNLPVSSSSSSTTTNINNSSSMNDIPTSASAIAAAAAAINSSLSSNTSPSPSSSSPSPNHQLIPNSLNLNNIVFVGQFPHLTQVQGRLDFLEFILSQSNLMLNIQQVDILWDSFIANALTSEERELCFLWLKNTKISGNAYRSTIPETVIRHLFLDKMPNMDWSHLGHASYSVFERFFFFVNEKAGKIKRFNQSSLFGSSTAGEMLNGQLTKSKSNNGNSPLLQPLNSNNNGNNSQQSSPQIIPQSSSQQNQQNQQLSNSPVPSPHSSPMLTSSSLVNNQLPSDYTPSDYYIASTDLMGISYLWSIALDCVNQDLSNSAINTLNNLYQSGENQKSIKFKEEFIKICIDNIGRNLSQIKVSSTREESVNRICRALSMLKIFKDTKNSDSNSGGSGSVDKIKNSLKNSFTSINNSNNSNSPFSGDRPLSFLVKFDRGDSYIISDIFGTDTLRMFKRKVASIYNVVPKPSVKSLKVYISDKELKDDDKTMEEYKILDSNGAQIYPLFVKRTITPSSLQQSPNPSNSNNNNNSNNNSNSLSNQQQQNYQSSLLPTTTLAQQQELSKKDKNKNNNGINANNKKKDKNNEDLDNDNDEDVDVLDDAPIPSIIIESLQHQLGGFGLIGDLLLRKVQDTNPKSKFGSNQKSKNEDLIISILSKSTYFDQIFNLLNLEEQIIAEKAWDILSELPLNEKLYKEIKNLSSDLSILFPTQSIFKTQYSLKVFESILKPATSASYQNNSGNNLITNSNSSGQINEKPSNFSLSGSSDSIPIISISSPNNVTVPANNSSINNSNTPQLSSYQPSPEEIKNIFIKKNGVGYLVKVFIQTPITKQKGTIKMFGSILKTLSTVALVQSKDQLKPSYSMLKKEFRKETSFSMGPDFINKLFEVISSICSMETQGNTKLTDDLNTLCHYGFEIFITSILSPSNNSGNNNNNNNNILNNLKQFNWDQWLKTLLLECPDRIIQVKVSNLLLNITTNFKSSNEHTNQTIDVSLFFLNILLNFLPQINQYHATAEQFFCLLSDLLCIGYPSTPTSTPKSISGKPTINGIVNNNNVSSSSNGSTSSSTTSSPLSLSSTPRNISSNSLPIAKTSPRDFESANLYDSHHQDKNESVDFIRNLLSNLIHQLKTIQTRERNNSDQKDHILIGILNGIRNLIRRRSSLKQLCKEKQLIEFLFHNCLFMTPSANDHGSLDQPPLCKMKGTRIACFRLLKELAKNDSQSFYNVVGLITNEIDSIEPVNDWNYSPLEKEKSIYGYVGLKNQGATCYMNSLLQQLFSSPHLRNGILSMNLSNLLNSVLELQQQILSQNPSLPQQQQQTQTQQQNNSNNYQPPLPPPTIQNQQSQQQQQFNSIYPTPNTNNSIISININNKELQKKAEDYNLLNQLQLLFIYLQESSKKYYDPYNFCRTIRNYNGEIINPGIQMDAYEFFLLLLEKLEDLMKEMPQQNLLKQTYGGVLTNQIISKECTHRSHREEPFLSLSMDVKNKRSLSESLVSFIDEELLVGDNKYKCESCDGRVDAIKRTLIDKLPNTLILQLKRFEFDLDNMRNNKLNDFYEFPTVLDIEPFTVESVERKEKNNILMMSSMDPNQYKYTLSGIVLHQGTADSGHYISLIKDANGSWFELNDTLVLPYDPNRIPIDCFGGFEEVREVDKETQKPIMVKRPKTCNAYMLFYNKVLPNYNDEEKKESIESVDKESTVSESIQVNDHQNNLNEDTNSSTGSIDTSTTSISTVTTASSNNNNVPTIVTAPPSPSPIIKSNNNNLLELKKSNSNQKVSIEALEIVWNENKIYLKEKFLYDLDFATFVWDIANLYHNPTFEPLSPTLVNNLNVSKEYQESILSSIKVSTKFLIEIYSHSKEKRIIDVWAYHIKRLLRESVEGAEWLLNLLVEKKNLLRGILITCLFEKTKSTFVDIISFAVTLRKNIQLPTSRNQIAPSIISLCNLLMVMVKSYKEYSKRVTQQLFSLLLNIVQECDNEREYLLQKGIISKLIDTFIGSYSILNNNGNHNNSSNNNNSNNQSSYTNYNYSGGSSSSTGSHPFSSNNSNQNNHQNNNQLSEPNKLLDLVSYLIRHCQSFQDSTISTSSLTNYPSEKDRMKPRIHILLSNKLKPTLSNYKSYSNDSIDPVLFNNNISNTISVGNNDSNNNSINYNNGKRNYLYIYSDSTFISILSKSFLIKTIKENGSSDSVKLMLKHLAWDNKFVSSHLIILIKETIVKSHVQLYWNILTSLTSLLELQDSVAQWRIEHFMTSLLLRLHESMAYNSEGLPVFLKYLGKITNFNSYSSSSFSAMTNYLPIQTEEFLNWKLKNKDIIIKAIKDR